MGNKSPNVLQISLPSGHYGPPHLAGQGARWACQPAGADEGDARSTIDVSSTDARNCRHCATEPVVDEICASYFENVQAKERIHVYRYRRRGTTARSARAGRRLSKIFFAGERVVTKFYGMKWCTLAVGRPASGTRAV